MTVSADGGGQQVFVVDGQALPQQLPVRPDGPRLSWVFPLLAVALLGIFIEAGFICHLYSRQSPQASDIPAVGYRKGDQDLRSSDNEIYEMASGKKTKSEGKPAAFLQNPSAGNDSVLHWRSDSFPAFLRGIKYMNNSLVFPQEGHYFIFSKVSHRENCNFFLHEVNRRTDSYGNRPITLMKSTRLPCDSSTAPATPERGSSYLGGVFHFHKNDSVFVTVDNSSQILYGTHENFFGAFMI